jgi:para-aminobenzoate synthetase component I
LFHAALASYPMGQQPFPVSLWGGIGYFSYEAAHCIEALPRTTLDDLHLPVLELVYYRDLLAFDLQKKAVFLVQAETGSGFSDPGEYASLLKSEEGEVGTYQAERPESCCSRDSYLFRVRKVRDYIKRGDVYEVNLSHRFAARYHGDEYGIFRTLYRTNPAPLSAYLNFGDTVIISNSPERFLRAEDAWVETRPIKGTVPRGSNEEEDLRLRMQLAHSEKDDAELSMIVDLLRNDLGKVCQVGSVRVREHKRIEGFANVWHLVSLVEGRIRKEEDYASLVRACFPGGSVTGCPKIRSMEIIDELETYRRNLYTGMLFIANDRRMDSSIVIRTIIATGGTLYFSVGGAIVYDSVPEGEYDETLAKAQSIMKVLTGGAQA